jgi:diguanylate cyclase (GGDEF)-like protein
MNHAVEQSVCHLFKVGELFKSTTENWIATHPDRDPRTDGDLTALMDAFRRLTNHQIDVRFISSSGDLYYIPTDPGRPRDNVADREYFQAAMPLAPGRRHIGIPVISRVTKTWRLPITSRLNPSRHDLAVLNTSVALDSLIKNFEIERPRPHGSITLLRTDGVLLARAPAMPEWVGRKLTLPDPAPIFTEPQGLTFIERSPLDGRARWVSHSRIEDLPLIVVVSAPLTDVLTEWRRQTLWTLGVLMIITGIALWFTFRLNSLLLVLQRHTREQERQATTDQLTGIANRAHSLKHLAEAFERSRRYGHPLSVLVLDIDHFKTINDRHGHAAGDAVLRGFTEKVSAMIRGIDTFGRIGGEEFLIVLPDTPLAGARDVAGRVGAEIEALIVPVEGNLLRVTVSIGVAERDEGDMDELLLAADRALYQAKAQGRNRIVACEPPAAAAPTSPA